MAGGGPPCSPATARTRCTCWSSAPASAACAAAFNSSIVRWRPRAINRLQGQGKTVKILCVGKKGYDQLRRQFAPRQIIDLIDLRVACASCRLRHADPIAKKIIALFEAGEFDVATLFFSRFKFGDRADPDGAADHPGEDRRRKAGELQPPPTNTSRRRGDSRDAAAAQHLGAGVPRAAGKRRLRTGRAHVRHGQCHAQRRRHDPQADDQSYNRTRQAQITKELIEIISGAEAL